MEGVSSLRRTSREMPRNGAVMRHDELAQTAARAASSAAFSRATAAFSPANAS